MNKTFKSLIGNEPILLIDSYGNKRAEIYADKGNYVTIHDIDLGKSILIYIDDVDRILYRFNGSNILEALNIL